MGLNQGDYGFKPRLVVVKAVLVVVVVLLLLLLTTISLQGFLGKGESWPGKELTAGLLSGNHGNHGHDGKPGVQTTGSANNWSRQTRYV